MMKRMAALLLMAVLLVSMAGAQAASLYSPGVPVETTMRLSTRSGPSTNYTSMGSYFQAGEWVTAISRAYDGRNGVWWVQVELSYRGQLRRVYTGIKRLGMALNEVPEEVLLGSGVVRSDAAAFNGPGTAYDALSFMIPAGTAGEVYWEENGYVQFEYWDVAAELYRRVWLWSGDVYGYVSPGYQPSWPVTPSAPAQAQRLTAPSLNSRVYGSGECGLVILWVQSQLKTLGYYTQVDATGYDSCELTGCLDAATVSAVCRFQQDNGLSVTGLVTQTVVDTIRMRQQFASVTQRPVYTGGAYEVLDNWYETPLTPGERRGEEIRTLQTMLQRLGYDPGSIDGAMGSNTLRAFNNWQADHGFARSGEVLWGHVYCMLGQFVSDGGDAWSLPVR